MLSHFDLTIYHLKKIQSNLKSCSLFKLLELNELNLRFFQYNYVIYFDKFERNLSR